jgi:2-iminobutanoate/2-iminopropanoate deaminase
MPREVISTPDAPEYPSYSQAILRAGGAELSDAVMVHTLLLRPEDADGVVEVFDEFFPDVRPPRCVSKLGVDRPGILVSIAMVAVID